MIAAGSMRIDIFTGIISQYSVLNHFAFKLNEALQSMGVKTRLLDARKDLAPALMQDRPDCTLSMNGMLPNKNRQFLCDHIRIPHISYLTDSPLHFMFLRNSPYSIITCVDRMAAYFIRSTGFSNVIFMPHAIESSLKVDPNTPRPYDVVLLATCIDHEEIRKSWRQKYSLPLCHVMEEAADITLSDQSTPYHLAFVQALDSHEKDRSTIDQRRLELIPIFNEIELYVRGKDRFELIKGIKDAKVHVFGSQAKIGGGWEKYLGNQSNVTIYPAASFTQALEIMQKSKIILNSCPSIKHGGHERIFAGLASGALVLTSDNPYLHEQFSEGESIAFYRHNQWDKVNACVNDYLSDEPKRAAVAAKGQDIVAKFHTWEQRAQELMEVLPSLIERIKLSQTPSKTS